MRLPLLALLFALAVAPAAQTVSTITFPTAQSMDGLYVDPSGQLFATGGFVGTNLYRLTVEGDLSVFATGLDGPIHLTESPDGNYYATDFTATSATSGSVSRVTPDGQVSVIAKVDAGPSDIVAAPDGSLYVTHFGYVQAPDGDSITRIRPDGTVEVFAEGGLLRAPVGLDFDDDGNLYAANIFDGRIVKLAPDGSQSLFASLPATSPFTIGHLVWANGRLYATYLGANQVVAFDPDGTLHVVAGSGQAGDTDGPAATATFRSPNGIAASVTGDTLFVSQYIGPVDRIRMITGVTAVAAETPAAPSGLGLRSAPNPLGDATTVRFDLAAPADVSLAVHDVLGREVARLAAGPRGAGEHAVRWAPRALPSGVYVLRLRAGAASATHRVVVER